MKYLIGERLIHKSCNLMKEVVGYNYDLFGEYVTLKIIDDFNWPPYHVKGQKHTYDISILNEYRRLENDK